jgi:hypothetical protein
MGGAPNISANLMGKVEVLVVFDFDLLSLYAEA